MHLLEGFLNTFWVIAFLPILSAVVIATFARFLGRKAWWVGATLMGVSLVWSLGVLGALAFGGEHGGGEHAAAAAETVKFLTIPAKTLVWHNWAPFGTFNMDMGLQVDNLTAMMLVVVTLVSFCVQVYSSGYFEQSEKRFTRFYAAINLFTTGMLWLVLADNLFLLLVSWEIMGLCSYLLIGHWYEQEWPRMGQIKAFLTTRVGDVGMMVGIWIIFSQVQTLSWAGLAEKVPQAVAAGNGPLLALGAFLLFTGAMGKSAQFPLHTWLPDAMAGPTPGSALIHAATMVAAGVYLVGRAFMVFGNVPEWVLATIAFIGAFTSLFAASIATLRHDIKEVLAYSTISQLGYMIMALGLKGWAAGNFHMVTHAFFKALLFLAAGSVIHAAHHNQLLHKMGGLWRKIPITFVTWMVGYLALAGFPGFSGFFSKDELLLAAFTWHNEAVPHWATMLPFIMALLTAFLTAYYMTRATWLAFGGKPRDHHLYEHAHESPPAMTIPLIILAIPALLSGWLWAALPAEWLHSEKLLFLEHFFHLPGAEHVVDPGVPVQVTIMATTAGLTGIALGLVLYAVVKPDVRAGWIRAGKPIYTLVRNKYYVDELYDFVFVQGTLGASKVIALFDGKVVDGIVNSVGVLGTWIADAADWVDWNIVDKLVTMWAGFARTLASGFRRISTGYVQQYMLTLVVVVVASVLLFQAIIR
ncbi:MAG TPA: NADH-quinone oxidoreductase subunit L [Symbiobacteriaceae bacterium]|nr:NADH-quinone oxidoreductase subunit L [Symbiobacteriaceae bacterium]